MGVLLGTVIAFAIVVIATIPGMLANARTFPKFG
jgi:hypothetical protein